MADPHPHGASRLSHDSLQAILELLIMPSRSGLYLSRLDMLGLARRLELAVGVADRRRMLEQLLMAANEHGRLAGFLGLLIDQLEDWKEAFAAWSTAYPASGHIWQTWLKAASATQSSLQRIREAAVGAGHTR